MQKLLFIIKILVSFWVSFTLWQSEFQECEDIGYFKTGTHPHECRHMIYCRPETVSKTKFYDYQPRT